MKLGYPNHPRLDIVGEIQWIASAGFDFVDLFLEPDKGAAECVDTASVRAALDAHGLDVVGHLAWYLPIGSAMREMRKAAVDAARTYLEVFARIGTPRVTIHASWPTSMFTAAEGVAWQSESLHELEKAAREFGVGLMFEPVGSPHETRENIEKIMNEHPDLGFHLDIGHFNLNQRKPLDFAQAFADRLVHVHLHDNDGSKDQHLPPG
ncbi:MAG TPA: sugar phosphate isomerase/epimerase, partial [Candidatus Ozemobacteraceae bacterium]|nr:sugar phosphate isomerase/epimerase [Candidatus Ozemobacteraceae bacterium]